MSAVSGFAALLALLLFCGAITGIIPATAIAVAVPNELRGVCLGACIVVGSIVGLGVAPTLVTVVSGALGAEAHLAQALAVTGVIIGVVSLLALTVARKRAPLRPE